MKEKGKASFKFHLFTKDKMSLFLSSSENKVRYIGLNQDHSCFSLVTKDGIEVWGQDPLKLRVQRNFEEPLGIVEMLFRSNIMILVGGKFNKTNPPNKLGIWDDYKCKFLAEIIFRTDIKNVRVKRDRILVALECKVYMYSFSDLQLVFQAETTPNPKGLLCLCPDPEKDILAFPGLKSGYVNLRNCGKSIFVRAHDNALSCIALSVDGKKLATSSERGTVIRIFETDTGEKISELRRGKDQAEISCISFSRDAEWICVSSDKGTVHVFCISNPEKSQKSSLSFMGSVLPFSLGEYLSSVFSFSQFRIKEQKSLCCFGHSNRIVHVLCQNGDFFEFSHDLETGGEGKVEIKDTFLRE